MVRAKKSALLGLATTVCLAALAVTLAAGVAQAGTVTVTNVQAPVLGQVNIVDTLASVGTVNAGAIALTSSIGALNTYCVDLFDYINLGSGQNLTFNQNALSTSSTYKPTGSNQSAVTPVNWTQTQVNLMNALLSNGTMQGANLNTTALQVAIWEVEYGTAATNGTYNLGSTSQTFYFTGDFSAGSTLNTAQTYLTNATSGVWSVNNSNVVQYLTASAPGNVQNLVYLAQGAAAAPEPSTIALFGLGLTGLWAARRRKLI